MDAKLEIEKQLNHLGYILEPYKEEDESALYSIFREVVDSGSQFPYESNSKEEFQKRFFGQGSRVYVCHSLDGKVVGGFFLRQNFPGRSDHIANAAYMIESGCRGKGIGTLMVKASLIYAKELGFKAMQFNMVFSQNTGAVRLYERLGFQISGTLPNAIRNPDGSYQDGYVMYRII